MAGRRNAPRNGIARRFRIRFGFENLNQHFASYYYRLADADPTRTAGYETDGLTSLLLDYLRAYERDQPLFAVLSVTPPHFPLIVPEEWKRFDSAALAVRPNFHDTPAMRQALATYYAMIENLDWNIGRVLETLTAAARFRDTLVVYFSDHGDYLGSHHLCERKEHPHEESVRIPAIFHWPGQIPARGLCDGLFSLVDLLPTTLGLIGVEAPAWVQGADCAPAVRGETAAMPDAVLLEMVGNPRWNMSFLDWRGFVDARWKYAFYEDGLELLYDLDADPYEQHNLIGEDPVRDATMRQRLLRMLAEAREPFFDVVIEHGHQLNAPDLDVSGEPHPWAGLPFAPVAEMA